MHINMDRLLEEFREEVDKKIRFLEGRISHLEDAIAVLKERLRLLEEEGGRSGVR